MARLECPKCKRRVKDTLGMCPFCGCKFNTRVVGKDSPKSAKIQLVGNLATGIAFLLLVSKYVYHVETYIGWPLLIFGILFLIWSHIEKKMTVEERKEGSGDEQ